MPLFPQTFLDDLRLRVDIVQVVQDVVSLRKAGATWKGLCPFHAEKTPSFHVNQEKGFFHCFGCGVGGDAIKFVELHERVGFPEAVRLLAGRVGLTVPEPVDDRGEGPSATERETLLKIHEAAAAWFQEQLAGPAGQRARRHLEARGVSPATTERLGLGCAPSTRDGLRSYLLGRGFEPSTLLGSGLIVRRDSGEELDRFRGRLMIPISRDTGSVIAFGGRALDAEQQPKYLNSPETALYSKSRTLYGMSLAKAAIRKLDRAILVEGYFDVAQLIQAGITPVVASCGTALTPQQAQMLRRFTSKVVLSFDPDSAGQGAAVRSCELLVAEGFEVNVAELPRGTDPDSFVRQEGRDAYLGRLRAAVPYLEFLLRRAAAGHDLTSDAGRRRFLAEMLTVAARIPDAATRDQFADRLASRARITEEVVRAEVRKAAAARKTSLPARVLGEPAGQLNTAERALLWALINAPETVRAVVAELDAEDRSQLGAGRVLELATELQEVPDEGFPAALLERLTDQEREQVTGIAAAPECPALSAEDCVGTLKLLRFDREREALQREIDRLQDTVSPETRARLDELSLQKIELKRRIEALSAQ